MNLPKLLIFVFILLALFVSFPQYFINDEVRAKELKKCAIPDLILAKQQAKAIFVGKIISQTETDNVKTFKFKVEKYWKGKKSKTISINVYENTRYQTWFEVGKKYLIFASNNENKNLFVERCSRSSDVESATNDLKSLGKAKKP